MDSRDPRRPQDPDRSLGFVPEEDEELEEVVPEEEDLEATRIEMPREDCEDDESSAVPPVIEPDEVPAPEPPSEDAAATLLESDFAARTESRVADGEALDSGVSEASSGASEMSAGLDSGLTDSGALRPREERPVLRTVGLAGSPIRGKVIRRLGGGGFGEVFEVEYADCLEAWKFIPKERTQDNAVSEEVRNAMRLCRENPDVVETFGIHVDTEQKNWIIRMELVPGRDLHRVVREDGILDLERVVEIGRHVASALHTSHTQFGIVHQDIKPKNLIWNEQTGQVKITDFGISVSLARGSGDAGVRGTPVYMAPEQLTSEGAVDPRVDQWAFGVTMYFLLTGRLPFDVSRRRRRPMTVYEDMARLGTVPLTDRLPVLDPELGAILERCYAWHAGQRYRDLAEVSEVLTDWWDRFPEGAGAASRRAYRRAQSAYLCCRHDEAVAEFDSVLESESGAETVLAERARDGAEASRRAARELEEELSAIQEVIDQGKYSEAYERLTRIEPRFSRCQKRRAMVDRLEVAIVQRWEHARPEVKRLVELTEFERASGYVKELRQFLDHRSLKWRLLGSDASRDETGTQTILRELDDLIEERQGDFCEQLESMDAAIDQERYREAQEELGKLQGRFPQRRSDFEKYADALARAVKNRERLAPIRLERLQALREDPSLLVPGERLDFEVLIRACEQFIEDFPAKRFPRSLEYGRLRDELIRLRRVLGERLRAGLDKAKALGGELKAARDEAVQHLALARQTDLLSPEEASDLETIVSRFETRRELCQEREEQARASLEARRWDQALIQLEECERLEPAEPEVVQALIQEARQKGLKARELEDRLRTQRYNLLSRVPQGDPESWHGYLQEIVHYLGDSFELMTLQDQDSAARTRENARLVFAAPLGPARRAFEQAETFRDSLAILQRLGQIVHEGAPRFQPRRPLVLVRDDGTLHERLVELFEAFTRPLRTCVLESETLSLCETLIDELNPWAQLLQPIELPERHPVVVLAKSVREWKPPEEELGERLSFEERCRRLAWQEEIIRSLVMLGPPSAQPMLQSIADDVASERRREVGGYRRRRVLRIVRLAFAGIVLMGVGGFLAWTLRDRFDREQLVTSFEEAWSDAARASGATASVLIDRFEELDGPTDQRQVIARLESLKGDKTPLAKVVAWAEILELLAEDTSRAPEPLRQMMAKSLDAWWHQAWLPGPFEEEAAEVVLALYAGRIDRLSELTDELGLPDQLAAAWRSDLSVARDAVSRTRASRDRLELLLDRFDRLPPNRLTEEQLDRDLSSLATPSAGSKATKELAGAIEELIRDWPDVSVSSSARSSLVQTRVEALNRRALIETIQESIEEVMGEPRGTTIAALDRTLYYKLHWLEQVKGE
ncbi:MAG: protein kinase [Planctomycetota bacterium]